MPFHPTDANLHRMRALASLNYTPDQISRYFRCSISCVRKWLHRFLHEVEPNFAHDMRKGHSGRHYKLDDIQLEEIRRTIHQNPSNHISRLRQVLNLQVNEKTIRRSIKKRLSINFYKAVRKAVLTQEDMNARLAYANENVNRTEEQWRRTVSIDEKVFSTSKDGNFPAFI